MKEVIRINTVSAGPILLPLEETGLPWPPPKYVVIENGGLREATKDDPDYLVLRRVRMSELTDDQVNSVDYLARGAEYDYVKVWPKH